METPLMFSAEWWQQPLGSWMAWNRVTIAFFIYIFGSIAAMGLWEYFSPGGSPRRGIFRLAWLGFLGTPLWGALLISVIWAVIVFRWA